MVVVLCLEAIQHLVFEILSLVQQKERQSKEV